MDEVKPCSPAEEKEQRLREQYANWTNEGKQSINAFLWKHLPGSVTMDKAEDIALEIYRLIDDEYDRAILALKD